MSDEKIDQYVEPKSSIEVSQNASGKFAYKVKLYFDYNDIVFDDLSNDSKRIFDLLKEEFEGKS